MSEKFPSAPNHNPQPAEEARAVSLNLPSVLGHLSQPHQERLDSLAMSVIPWRGDGYTYGMNGLFQFVPSDLLQEVTEYVTGTQEDNSDEKQEEIIMKLREVWKERRFNEMTTDEIRSFA